MRGGNVGIDDLESIQGVKDGSTQVRRDEVIGESFIFIIHARCPEIWWQTRVSRMYASSEALLL
jgi:hypothetical protein